MGLLWGVYHWCDTGAQQLSQWKTLPALTCILDFLLGFVTHVSGSTIQQCNIAETVHHQRSHYRTTRSPFGDDALLQLD